MLQQVSRWFRRHVTAEGRVLARRLEESRPYRLDPSAPTRPTSQLFLSRIGVLRHRARE
jgi:hypothetical protein